MGPRPTASAVSRFAGSTPARAPSRQACLQESAESRVSGMDGIEAQMAGVAAGRREEGALGQQDPFPASLAHERVDIAAARQPRPQEQAGAAFLLDRQTGGDQRSPRLGAGLGESVPEAGDVAAEPTGGQRLGDHRLGQCRPGQDREQLLFHQA